MLSKIIEDALNKQIKIEAESSQIYLAMACWAEIQGLEGVADFMYKQSDEEREHMLKLVKFANERGRHAKVSALSAPDVTFNSFKEMFERLLKHEMFVSQSINELVHITLQEKDYATLTSYNGMSLNKLKKKLLLELYLIKLNLLATIKEVFIYLIEILKR